MVKKPIARKSQRASETDLLESFLGSVENFVGEVSAEAVKAAPKGEQQVLIQATGDSLMGQTNKLTAFIRESAARLSATQRLELDKFLQVQDGVAMANRGVAVTKQLLGTGIFGKLLHWIAQHIKEIKKILLAILHFIFDLLHIPFPEWINTLFLIIDEIFDLLMSLLSEVFGIDFGRAARQFSEQEVDFLHEWAAFEAVRAARNGRRATNQDETK
jgi:hypothetical protein